MPDEPEKVIGGRKETDAASRTRMNDEGQRKRSSVLADERAEIDEEDRRERGAVKNPGPAGTQGKTGHDRLPPRP